MMGYYRSTDTNPNWFNMWLEQFDENGDVPDILDQLAELSCGINPHSASDACQQYAKHVRTHLEAGYLLGYYVARQSFRKDLDQLLTTSPKKVSIEETQKPEGVK